MTQHDAGTFGAPSDQFGDPGAFETPRTSVLAILALVCALFICLPVAPIGVLLGILALVTMAGKSHLRGRGMAIAAIVIGLVVSAIWAFVVWIAVLYGVPAAKFVAEGPTAAMQALTGDDVAEFKASFRGAGATAGDEVAQQFMDEVTRRYGIFSLARLDQSAQSAGGQQGSPAVELPYVLEFAGGKSIPADVELIFADQQTGAMVLKLGWIRINDEKNGDLRYPPLPETPKGPNDPASTSGGGAADQKP
ncbi:MAG: DUF4190 domain-containing protein [Phycisphaerales bacterium]|nr:DUF4190 domain-containing protein [Phycisphaerales bacterium]